MKVNFIFRFKGKRIINFMNWIFLLLYAAAAPALTVTYDLTEPLLPVGWRVEKIDEHYADGSLKMDGSGALLETSLFPAPVEALALTLQGKSISPESFLSIYTSSDGIQFSSTAWTNLTAIGGSKRTYQLVPPADPHARAFRLVYTKKTGNLGLFSLTATYSDASAPPIPSSIPPEQVGANSFLACWETVPGAEAYLLSLERILSPMQEVAHRFDLHPDGIPADWSIPSTDFAETDSSSGIAPRALRLAASGEILTTPLFTSPLTSFSFWGKTTTKAPHQITMKVLTNGVWATWESFLPSTSQATFEAAFPKEIGCRQVKLEFQSGGSGKLMVDDVVILLAEQTEDVYEGIAVGNTNRYEIADLPSGSYRYAVAASNQWGISSYSNWMGVDIRRRVPTIEPIPVQRVRVGETLTLPIVFGETDGDPILMTNVVAEGVSGAYGLNGATFTYTPTEADIGEKSFTISAEDADGTQRLVLLVEVRAQPLAALPIATVPGSYSQDFDLLLAEEKNEWDQGVTPLRGWYAHSSEGGENIYFGKGGSSGIWSFEGRAAGDRQLGFRGRKETRYHFGFSLTNDTSLVVRSFTLSFDAIQKYIGAESAAFVFCYRVGTRADKLDLGGWRRVPELCFETPAVTPPGGKNAATNLIRHLSARLCTEIAPNGVISFRWSDFETGGADARLAVDQLNVSWDAYGTMDNAVSLGKDETPITFDEMEDGESALLPVGWRIQPVMEDPIGWSNGESVAGRLVEGKIASGQLDQALIPILEGGTNEVFLIGHFRNDTGFPISTWEVSYDLPKFRNGAEQIFVGLHTSLDGKSWQSVTGSEFSTGNDADSLVCSPIESNPRMTEIGFPHQIAKNAEFYLAWGFRGAGNGRQYPVVGINNLAIKPVVSRGTILMLQ